MISAQSISRLTNKIIPLRVGDKHKGMFNIKNTNFIFDSKNIYDKNLLNYYFNTLHKEA